jgi:hypothetical protein
MEFNFGTQPQKKIMQRDKNRKDTHSIARIAAGTVPSDKFIQAPKMKLKKCGFILFRGLFRFQQTL